MFSFLFKHYIASSLIFLFLCLTLFFGSVPSMNNDDFQIAFCINGGGETAGSFGVYVHTLIGSLCTLLLNFSTSVCWYLVVLTTVNIAAFFSVLLYTMREIRSDHSPKAYRGILYSFLAVTLLYGCLDSLATNQYTHIAILTGGSGILWFSCSLRTPRFSIFIIPAILLVALGCMMRADSVFSVLFLYIAVCLTFLIRDRFRLLKNLNFIIGSIGMLAAIITLNTIDRFTIEGSPEWEQAYTDRKTMVEIVDYPDNSGLNKDEICKENGISPLEFKLLKSFFYVPRFQDSRETRIAERIHKRDRRGLFGLETTSEIGLLTPSIKKLFEPFSSLMMLTKWCIFGMTCFLFVITFCKKSAKNCLPMIIVVIGYVVTLIMVGRCTGRVTNPVLFIASVWVLTHLPRHAPFLQKKWAVATVSIILLCGCAFTFRHTLGHRFWNARAEAHEYCAARPENLYITTNQQGCGLFPVGFTGYSMDYLHKTNVLPVGDGWMFYTPAYRAALAARKIENPYRELLKDNVYVITFRQEDKWVLKQLSALHELYTGQGVEFSKVHAIGGHSFWKAHQLPNAAK